MNTEYISAKKILEGTSITVLDSARLMKSLLDSKHADSTLTDLQFCSKVIVSGLQNAHINEMSIAEGFALYLDCKRYLRRDSMRDIRCMGKRLFKANPELWRSNFSGLTTLESEKWLSEAFCTPSQFNKARTMLYGLFEFAVRREWCDRNPIKKIERSKIVENEIQPLKLVEIRRLIRRAENEGSNYAVAVALLVFGGIRPREVRRLTWGDIDIEENSITIRSQCSKTGGVRQVEIPPALRSLLMAHKSGNFEPNSLICPPDWTRRWRKIRDNSGFRGRWVCDVLRHTYASFHAKYYADLPRLQLNMGHRDLSLLRSRYVNMRGISKADAKNFFNYKIG